MRRAFVILTVAAVCLFAAPAALATTQTASSGNVTRHLHASRARSRTSTACT